MQHSFELNLNKIVSARTGMIFLKIEFFSFVLDKRTGLNILTGTLDLGVNNDLLPQHRKNLFY